MSRSKKESREGRLGTALGALAFASIGAAVVLVPKVRKAVIGAAGMAYEAIQDCCTESGSSAEPTPGETETQPRPRPAARTTTASAAQRAANATPDPTVSEKVADAEEEAEEEISPVGTEARGEVDRTTPAQPVRPKAGHRRIAEEESPKTSAPRSAKAKRKPSRKGGTTKTTSPGFVNPNDQKVIRRAGKSESWKSQYVYELECGECGHRYGAHGPEIKNRLCPECQGGTEGEPV